MTVLESTTGSVDHRRINALFKMLLLKCSGTVTKMPEVEQCLSEFLTHKLGFGLAALWVTSDKALQLSTTILWLA